MAIEREATVSFFVPESESGSRKGSRQLLSSCLSQRVAVEREAEASFFVPESESGSRKGSSSFFLRA